MFVNGGLLTFYTKLIGLSEGQLNRVDLSFLIHLWNWLKCISSYEGGLNVRKIKLDILSSLMTIKGLCKSVTFLHQTLVLKAEIARFCHNQVVMNLDVK